MAGDSLQMLRGSVWTPLHFISPTCFIHIMAVCIISQKNVFEWGSTFQWLLLGLSLTCTLEKKAENSPKRSNAGRKKTTQPGAHRTARQSTPSTSFSIKPNIFYQAPSKSTWRPPRLLPVWFSLFKQKLQPLISLVWLKGPVIHGLLGSVTVLADPTVSRLWPPNASGINYRWHSNI